MGKKYFVLDTNILLQSPNAIFGFADNIVVITSTVLQELDSKKNIVGEIGYNAREAIRHIEELREKTIDLVKGASLENNGELTVYIGKSVALPKDYSMDRADNRIIADCLSLIQESVGKQVILVTNDLSMRINASVLGVPVEGYKNEQITSEETYTGRLECMDLLVHSKEEIRLPDLISNQYIQFADGLAKETDGDLEILKESDWKTDYCTPRNAGQRFALHALLSEDIPLVILKGPAGSAKTFLSMAAAFDKYYDDKYEKIMITRTNTLSDAELGFLPGDLEDKMMPLIMPFIDNAQTLLSGINGYGHKDGVNEAKMQIEEMIDTGALEICSMAYMRGRSLNNTFIIIDEAQNATRGQILEIVTRAGKGTKVVVCGDPDQIDNSKLDKYNNGLAFVSERMKGSSLCAQITFKQSETVRSELASEAAERLKI